MRDFERWLPVKLVCALIEGGHLDEVRGPAGDGDWHCGQALAEHLAGQGRVDAAVDVLRPFVDRGRWDAVDTLAGLLDVDAAVALVRRHGGAGGQDTGLRLAGLLARQGRTDEVFAMLLPFVADSSYAQLLVRLTAGGQHDAELEAVLRAQLADRHGSPWADATLLATVLERQGRVDEAVALLLAHGHDPLSHVEEAANLLARHGREAQLRELVAGPGGERAALRLVAWLQEQGRDDDAMEVLRAQSSSEAAVVLAELLVEHGRTDEAIEVLRPRAGDDEGWVRGKLGELLVDVGRPDEALALADGLFERSYLLERCGRIDQAIAELRDDPEVGDPWLATRLAELLEEAGRLDEAADCPGLDPTRRAVLLVRQGRVAEAVDLVRAPVRERAAVERELDAAFWQRFIAQGRGRTTPGTSSGR